MSVRRNARIVALGGAFAQLAFGLRGIVVARLIGPENMGTVAAFFVLLAVVDVFGPLGVDAFVARRGPTPPPGVLRTTHAIAVVRGLAGALLLLAAALPFARSMEATEALAGFLTLALVPVLRGFISHGVYLQPRLARARAAAAQQLWSQGIGFLLGVAIAWWTGNWWAAVAFIVGQTLVQVVVSHLYAAVPWRLGFDAGVARASLAFGWPLFLSALAVVASRQGDRLLLGLAPGWFGASYDKAELGRYAVAATAAFLPLQFSRQLMRNAFLPWMIAAVEAAEVLRRRRITLICCGLTALAFAAFAASVAGGLLGLVVGPDFGDLTLLVAALGAAQAVQLLRLHAEAVALAAGVTAEVMIGEVVRLLCLVLALPVVMLGWRIEWLGVAAIAGELIAAAVTEARLHRRGLGNGRWRYSATLWGLGVVALAGLGALLAPRWGGWVLLLAGAGAAALGALAVRRWQPELWAQILRFVDLVRRGRPDAPPEERPGQA
jgi:O-antigen/teichoic acid export membrane protein